MTPPPGSLRVELAPDAALWPALVERGVERRDMHAAVTRRELGLSVDRPVVMTGHQLVLWHAGILAKLLAAHAVAERTGADVAWVGVDQDSELATELRFPAANAERGLRVDTVPLRRAISGDVAAASLPAEAAPDLPTIPFATEDVRRGVHAIHSAWNSHAHAASAARQVANTLSDLLAPWIPTTTAVLATALARTSLFRSVIDRMRSDPRGCVEAYNAAVAANPAAQMQPLRVDSGSIELPVWMLAPGQSRRRVFAADLSTLDPATLAPRALLMTGLLRWAACDLFVHGTGGAIYDTVTDRWLGDWLGITLAPTVMATADLFLPLQQPGATPRAAADAHWRSHRAEHDPAIVGDAAAAAAKQALVERIAVRRRAGERPLDDYRRMHAALTDYRARHAATLSELKSSAERLSREAASSAMATDRTWAFPLHPTAALEDLRSAIESRFA